MLTGTSRFLFRIFPTLVAFRSLSTSSVAAMRVIPVPCRSDNYMYILQDEATSTNAVVDPYDPAKLQKAADDNEIKIGEIVLTTHHHHDHSGGNEEFVSKHGTQTVYAGSDKSPKANKILKHQDKFQIGNLKVTALHTPCHTQDHICYYVEDEAKNERAVFTGDTLFVSGCGRFFEGTPEEMNAALNDKLAKLPEDTVTYVGHEYTASNVAFSKSIDPENESIRHLVDFCKNNEVTTGKFTIGDEKKFNVFMRLESQAVRDKAQTEDPIKAMAFLREAKNNFRG
ncbi:Cytoplasmic glyoxalase II [Microbotryomycetes sp. JL201]|nr:Cytoplasmic glyoxalase II [Microbotryomycetes sp. JL201]